MNSTKPQPNPNRTLDRNIAGGGFEVRVVGHFETGVKGHDFSRAVHADE
jgi:hypothetical protein